MRSMWKGAIAFGLVSIPVKLYAATEEHGVTLHQVHAADGGRIRMKRTCEECGKEVAYTDIAKGYQDDDGRTVVLTDDDLAELPLPSKKLIDVLAFIDTDDVDPLTFSRAYYVGADSPAAAKPYVLLREALATSGKAAVTKIALRTRESLALLRVHDSALVLHTMYWPDEVRSAEGLAPSGKITVRPQELKMAASLMDTLSEDFELEALHDDYQQALDQLVAARLEGVTAPAVEERAPAQADVIDLMSALQASIDARAEGGGAGRKGRTPAAQKTAASAKKTDTKKTAASANKTTSAKKATAKKTAAKKPAGGRKVS